MSMSRITVKFRDEDSPSWTRIGFLHTEIINGMLEILEYVTAESDRVIYSTMFPMDVVFCISEDFVL